MERINDNWRLNFHLMPPKGWMNDPNGLCYNKGEYHVFFQYAPEQVNGGITHWGHYKSKDFITWEFTGIPVKAEESFEKDGSYSGCTFVEDDVMHLFYTGNVKHKGNYDYITAGREANVVHAIYTPEGEGKDKKCVLTNADYPKGFTQHIRDPKVWKEADSYYMVLGARSSEDVGKVLIFTSSDLMEWNYLQEVTSEKKAGFMWECPDYFEVNGMKLLSVSPQGIPCKTHQYQNVYQSGYYEVEGDITKDCEVKNFEEWDMGFDFYAPQTFEDEKGRRIIIGWMGIPDADYTNPTVERGWQHALTMPRQILVKDKVVYQQPLEELKALRKEARILKDKVTEEVCTAELFVDKINSRDCSVTIAEGLKFVYSGKEQYMALMLDNELGYGRTKRFCDLKICRNMRIFIDTSAVEIFVNDGEKVFASRYYAKGDAKSVRVDCKNSENTIWELDSFQVKYKNE